MFRKTCWLAVLALAGACGPREGADGVPLINGFNPTPPATGQLQLVTPRLPDIPAGKDITYCSYLKDTASKTLDVTSYLGFQPQGGHHSILYATARPQTPNTHECTDDDMYNVQYIGGGGTDSTIAATDLPPGIVFRIQQGEQFMILSHWINASQQPVQAQAAYDLTVEDPLPSSQPADLFTVVTTDISLAPGLVGTASADCTMQQDMQFFVIGGHAHEWATHVTMTHTSGAATPVTDYDYPWNPGLVFDTPLKKYDPTAPLVYHQGDQVHVGCTYLNTTDATIQFPTEMCVGYGYYFPATREIDCVDGQWN